MIEISMDFVVLVIFVFLVGCYFVSKLVKNGRMVSKMKEVECYWGDIIKIVVIIVNNVLMMW